MIRIIAARLVDLGFVLIGISLLVFCMIRFIPGDAVAIMLGANTEVTPDRVAALRSQLGLGARHVGLLAAHLHRGHDRDPDQRRQAGTGRQ